MADRIDLAAPGAAADSLSDAIRALPVAGVDDAASTIGEVLALAVAVAPRVDAVEVFQAAVETDVLGGIDGDTLAMQQARSAVSEDVPPELAAGRLHLNLADGTIHAGDPDGVPIRMAPSVAEMTAATAPAAVAARDYVPPIEAGVAQPFGEWIQTRLAVSMFDGMSRALRERVRSAAWSSGDDVAVRTALSALALEVYDAGGGAVVLPAGLIPQDQRIDIPDGVALVGAGRAATRMVLTGYERSVVLHEGSGVSGIRFDGGGFSGSSPVTKLAGITVIGSDAWVERCEVLGNYTGCVIGGVGVTRVSVHRLYSHGNVSRGLQFDPFCTGVIASQIWLSGDGNAGLLIGHGANKCQVHGLHATAIDGPAIWFQEGVYENIVRGGVLTDPTDLATVGINFAHGSYRNAVFGVDCYGYLRGVQMVGGPRDGAYPGGDYPEIVDHDTEHNVVEGCRFFGTSNTNTAAIGCYFQQDAGTIECKKNVIRNCEFDTFYGEFSNASDSANGAVIENIKSTNIGAGGILKGLKSNGVDVVKIDGIDGFPTRGVFSATQAVDSTGLKTVVITHTLPFTPTYAQVRAVIAREPMGSGADDARIDSLRVSAITSSAITIRFHVSTASATGGTTVRVMAMVDALAAEGFAVSQIT